MRRIYFPSLPDLWTNVRLFEISEVLMGQSPPGETYNGNKIGLPFFQGKAEFGDLYPNPQKWCSAPTRIAEADDILISVRAPVGSTNIATEQCCIGRGLAAIRPKNDVAERDFILFYLRATEKFLSTAGYGSTFQAINKNELVNLRLPLPPLFEQLKIVSILRQADELQQLRNDNLALIEKTTTNLFWNFFGDYFTKNRIKEGVRLGKYIEETQYGSSDSIKDYGKVPALRMNNITLHGWMDIKDLKYFDISDNELSSYCLKKGDILFNRTNSKELVGKTGLLEKDYNGFSFASYLIRIRLKEGLLPEYVWALLNSEYGKKKLFNMAKQAGNMANINATELGTIAIPKPDMILQQKFAKSIDEMRNIRTKTLKTVNNFDLLAENLCAQAFTGELTEYWRLKNQVELETAAKKRDTALGISRKKVTIKVHAPEERPWLAQPNRHWLMDQLSDLQGFVYEALREWKGTLIPSEDLETFREQAFPVEHLEDANDQILRVLHQLAGLGLIAKISLYNHEGDYVTAFRGLREEELSQVSDRQYLAKG